MASSRYCQSRTMVCLFMSVALLPTHLASLAAPETASEQLPAYFLGRSSATSIVESNTTAMDLKSKTTAAQLLSNGDVSSDPWQNEAAEEWNHSYTYLDRDVPYDVAAPYDSGEDDTGLFGSGQHANKRDYQQTHKLQHHYKHHHHHHHHRHHHQHQQRHKHGHRHHDHQHQQRHQHKASYRKQHKDKYQSEPNSGATADAVSCHCCHHEEKISDVWATCASSVNQQCASCSLFHAVHNHQKCGSDVAIVGEKVCPTTPIGGQEGITRNNAGSFGNVWRCAAKATGSSPNIGLILNPWKARTQHQLHIKTMPLDQRGVSLMKKLEKITKCRTGTWHNAHFKCPYSKARLYSSMPSVFSQVFSLASRGALGRLAVNPDGQTTLATVGITVLFICEGKPVVLAHGDGHGGCSIEHSIYTKR
eukprot:TRINITY_DN20779_c0_g1_i3.p1 TRINITY_DN20779_c0_g1~~TRINITY_DN20779_c0_g1_i3.p1  ORF type:complete len:444 (-),score=56.30 TRINITY_DN20779_c0_g1_i3:826-2082(-)